ncbi:lytic transglycosylase domain-containing protein [Novosphingobium sp. BL-8A]|uniref:lytic transglycosylase domain-containing protein n=1 Tax=unclassified Novosphingobium TaxID=2644732 RepID=UPI003756DBED
MGPVFSSSTQAKEADAVSHWRAEIGDASARFGIPAIWIERVMRAESRGHTTLDGRPIISRAGAMGLMQLMPDTWAELRRRLGLGSDPHAPRDNILAGTAYLRDMYDRFGYPGLFAAYNAGPARYAASLANGRPLPAETQAYLASVTGGDNGFLRRDSTEGAQTILAPSSPSGPIRQSIFIVRSSANAGTSPDVASDRHAPSQSGGAAEIDPLFAVRILGAGPAR